MRSILGLGESETKDLFSDYYFHTKGGSHIAYEYHTENGNFLFVVSRNKRLQYTFVDISGLENFNIEELLLSENGTPLIYEKMIDRLLAKNLDYYSTFKKEEYRNIFCKDEYKKMSPDFRRKNLSDIKFFLFKSKKDVDVYGRYLSKIFLNSKVSETSIKDMLTSLLNIDEESDSMIIATLDIDDLQMRLEKVAQKENDYKRFIEKIESGKIDRLEVNIKDYREMKTKLASNKKELLFVIENHLQISSYIKEKLTTALVLHNEKKSEYDTTDSSLTKEIEIVYNKFVLLEREVKDTILKKNDYEANNINKFLKRHYKEQDLKEKKTLLEKERDIANVGAEDIEVKKRLDKIKAIETINSNYKEEEILLNKTLSSLINKYKSINDFKLSRDKKELQPKGIEVDAIKLEESVLIGKINIANSEIKGLKKSKIENAFIIDIKDEIKRVQPLFDTNEKLLENTTTLIEKEEEKQNKNSDEFTKINSKIKLEYATKQKNIDEEIITNTNAKDKILCLDKESLFGKINRDDSVFKDLISFITKDEVLHDESVSIQKIDNSNSFYGYKIDIKPETIENKVLAIKQTIKDLKIKKTLALEDEKQELFLLEKRIKKESKRIKNIISNLDRDKNTFKNKNKKLSEELSALRTKLAEEEKVESQKIRDSILIKEEQVGLHSKEHLICQEIVLKLNAELELLQKEIVDELESKVKKIDKIDNDTNERQLVIASEKQSKISISNKKIDDIYLRVLEDRGSDTKRIVFLNNRVASINKILSSVDENRYYVLGYINTDIKNIDNLEENKKKLERLRGQKTSLEQRKKTILNTINKEVKELSGTHSKYQKKSEELVKFYSDKEDYVDDFKLESIDESFNLSIKDVLKKVEGNTNLITNLPEVILNTQESIKNGFLRIKDTMLYVTRGFTKENTLGLPVIDGETESPYEYISVGSVYIDYKNNELYKQGKELALDDLADTMRLISSNVNNIRDKIQQMESLLDVVNKTISKSIEDIGVIDRLEIKSAEDAHNPIISSLDSLVEYSDNNSHIYLGSLVREDDKKTFNKIYIDIEKIIRLLKDSRKRKVFVQDLVSITFKVGENGKDWGELTSLKDIGSNGTGIMAKAIIYLALLYQNAIKCKIHDNQYFHCIIDEIGQISENYFSELMLSAQKRGFIFLNGIPVDAENMIQLYPNIYTGYSENNSSDFVNTIKEYIDYE